MLSKITKNKEFVPCSANFLFCSRFVFSVLSKIIPCWAKYSLFKGFYDASGPLPKMKRLNKTFARCFPQLQNGNIEQKPLTKQNNKTKTLNKYMESWPDAPFWTRIAHSGYFWSRFWIPCWAKIQNPEQIPCWARKQNLEQGIEWDLRSRPLNTPLNH